MQFHQCWFLCYRICWLNWSLTSTHTTIYGSPKQHSTAFVPLHFFNPFLKAKVDPQAKCYYSVNHNCSYPLAVKDFISSLVHSFNGVHKPFVSQKH
jgi:hypothetical protein